MGTNVAVSAGAMNQLTTGTNNVAIGSGAGGEPYGILSASGNVMLGSNTGSLVKLGTRADLPSCMRGDNNNLVTSSWWHPM